MGSTPKGLRYPEPTDFVKDGATAIRTLAEDVDAAIGGALFRGTIGAESIANNADDYVELTLTSGDSSQFSSTGTNTVTYTGADCVAIVAVQIIWAANGSGYRRTAIEIDGAEVAVSKVSPDTGGESTIQNFSWPVVLNSGDDLKVKLKQDSGGALNLVSGKFRCVLLGLVGGGTGGGGGA